MRQYEIISQDIKKKIEDGELQPGDKIPSLNQMRTLYQCSKGTVLKAYEVLEKDFVIFSKPQSGFYVADHLYIDHEDSEDYELHSGNPVVNATSFNEVQQCLNIAAKSYSYQSLDVSVRGVDSLNQILPAYLEEDGIYAASKNIYLIQGIAQMLTIFSSMPFPNHKETILIEEPSFAFYIRYLKAMNYPVKTIARDEKGIDLKQLEHIFKHDNIKFFYTIPHHHNPLGTCLNHATRKKIMALAQKYDVYIIEDDYFSHYDYTPKYLPLYYFANQSHCIYLRSYTKIIPFIRIGIAVVTDDFIEAMNHMSQISYYYSYHMPSLVSQATLEAYITSGIYRSQAQIITHKVQKKMALVKRKAKDWQPDIMKLTGGGSGYYFLLTLSPKINRDFFIQELKRQHILVTSNEENYYHTTDDNSIRLSVSKISLQDLDSVLDTIYQSAMRIYQRKNNAEMKHA